MKMSMSSPDAPASKSPATLATLLVSCPDRRGIVATLSQVLFGHGANILDSDQHSDTGAGLFFQRIRFDTSELLTDHGTLERSIAEVAARFDMSYELRYANRVKRVAIFVSKYDHCLIDLLLRHRAGELPCEMAIVLSNHEELRECVVPFGVDFRVFPIDPATRESQEHDELELLDSLHIDLVVLARYMQILSADFTTRYAGRIINIHHSFLPAFIGGRPYHQAYERGVKLVGATAHYATSRLDEGPIVEQDVARCSHRDQISDLVRKGRDLERAVLARAVRWHLDDRVLIYGNKTVVFD
jgi:formyltetrahydrofolate deformylase